MKNICVFFQIHHPFYFQTFRFFDIGESKPYYNYGLIEKNIQEAIAHCYIPTNEYLLRLIDCYKGDLKLSFNISATALDQFLTYSPKLISSFRQLADTGQVEFTGNVSSHSIISLSTEEQTFIENIKKSRERVNYYFGQLPMIFINTDLLYTNQIAQAAASAGYQAILTNGINQILQWRSPNYLYSSDDQNPIKILFRNDRISNILGSILNLQKTSNLELIEAFNIIDAEEPVVNIYLDYKALGGVDREKKYRLMSRLVSRTIQSNQFCFELPSEIIKRFGPVSEIGTIEPVCWVDQFHPNYYPGNDLQKDAMRQLFKLTGKAEKLTNSNLKTDWEYLQTSDHFHLMDHNHPDYRIVDMERRMYKSKYEAYINYMNILSDFRSRLKKEIKDNRRRSTSFVSNKRHSFTN